MHIRLSAVIQLFDGYRMRPVRASEVSFLFDRAPVRPVYKQPGFFAFSNLPPGPVKIDILSAIFLPETLEVELPEEARSYCKIYRALNPGRTYPFRSAPTALSGRLVNNGVPSAHTQMLFYTTESRELLKVSQNDLKAGATEIKLFSSQQTWRLPLPGKFLILDKNEKNREMAFITDAHNGDNVYPLGGTLKYGHERATPLIEVMEFSTAADGSFYFAVPERNDTAGQAQLEIPAGKSWQVSITHGRETDVGDIVDTWP